MSKARKSSEVKKFLFILTLLIFVMTPFGKHAYMDASNWIGKKVANSFTSSPPKAPVATPTVAAKLSK